MASKPRVDSTNVQPSCMLLKGVDLVLESVPYPADVRPMKKCDQMGACLPRVMGIVILVQSGFLWALTRMAGDPVVLGKQPRGYGRRSAK